MAVNVPVMDIMHCSGSMAESPQTCPIAFHCRWLTRAGGQSGRGEGVVGGAARVVHQSAGRYGRLVIPGEVGPLTGPA